jgi:tetratricopeptide (TPR) repeat protein
VTAVRAFIAAVLTLAPAAAPALQALPPGPAPAPPTALQSQLEEVEEAIQRGELERAQALALRGQSTAHEAGATDLESQFFFYLGLERQRSATGITDEPTRQRILKKGADYYRRSLALKPRASVLNNLGQIEAETGQPAEAVAHLTQAVEMGGERRSFYERNLAAALEKRGDAPAAFQRCREAVRAQPEDREALRCVVRAGRGQPEDLVAFLWERAGAGGVAATQDAALQLLAERWGSDAVRVELLTLVAFTLSRQSYAAGEWLEGEVALDLRKLSADPAVGEGATCLRWLHGSVRDPARYAWWGRRGERSHDAPRGMWPREAFRALARALGRRAAAAGDEGGAEAYLLLAAHVDREETDPRAVLELADLYIAQGRKAEVQRLLEQEAPALFYGKGAAYRTSQLRRVYDFHRALGVIYASVEEGRPPASPQQPASATFQLEHALRAAETYNERAQREGRPDRIVAEPRLVNLLAGSYAKAGSPARADDLRLRSAEEYLELGDGDAAAVVLRPLGDASRGTLAPATRKRYELLVARLPATEKEKRNLVPRVERP